jgi:putative endopeptidase
MAGRAAPRRRAQPGPLLMARAVPAFIALAAIALVAAAAAPSRDVDASVRPGDDFYRYANGPWLDAASIPAGRPSVDTTALLREENARRVRALVEAAARGAPTGSSPATRALARKVGDYDASLTDEAGIEAKGMRPLAGALAEIAAIGDRGALSAALGRSLRPDDGTDSRTESLFGLWVHQGFTDAESYRPHLVQGGLGLFDADLYRGADNAALRERYQAHVATILRLAGFGRAEERAARILDLETAIAATHASSADTADPFKTNNNWRRADFGARAPGLDWDAFFGAAGLGRQSAFIVWQPSAVTGAAALVAARPIETWKDYLAFHRVDQAWTALPKAVRDAHLAFAGAPAQDRDTQALAATRDALGEAIGRLYVETWFPPRAKAAASAMRENIRAAFRARIARLAWMSPATKAKALAKLAALNVGIGYPDRWTDYSGLAVVRGDAWGNLRRANSFAYRSAVAKLGRPADPGEWSIVLPQDVGAILYFSPNTIQFSAGVLQPPYFDPAGDLASNYGSAGTGMAHEVGHSFDDLGRLYDARGRLGDWWTPADETAYRAAAAPLIAQFDAYCPRPRLCLRGKALFGENAADLAGLAAAHDAYLRALGGWPDIVKNGLTGEQRFFLAFARRWRRAQTEEALRRQVAADSHAPGDYRAAAVRNLDAWYGAYAVRPGDKLYLAPGARAHLW